MDLFVNSSPNNVFIRFCLVDQPKNKLFANNEKFNATDLSPITFGEILPLKRNSTNSQINLGTLDEKRNSKVCTKK